MNEEKKITADEFDKAVVKAAKELVEALEGEEDSAAKSIMVMTGLVFASSVRQELF